MQFIRAYPPAQAPAGPALWFPIHEGELILRKNGDTPELPRGEAKEALPGLELDSQVFIGTLDGLACVAVAVASPPPEDSYQKLGIRALFGLLDPQHYMVAGCAWQLLYWQQTGGFCARCGTAAEPSQGDWGMRCPACRHVTYPRVSPCTITLIHDNDRVLLTHQPGWGSRYGLVAGFVEPGETLEQGVIAGFPVVDVRVALVFGKYHPVDSSEAAFKTAGSVGFKAAFTQANPVLLEPVMHVEVTIPEEYLGPVTADERFGTVDDVVFPTGIDPRSANVYDVYYGAADAKIARARFGVTVD